MGNARTAASLARFAFAALACESTATKRISGFDRAICSYSGFTRWHGPHVAMDQSTTARASDAAASSRHARSSSAPFTTCRTEPHERAGVGAGAAAGAAAGAVAAAGLVAMPASISASLAGSGDAGCVVDGDAREV